jgi:hypothetical protein
MNDTIAETDVRADYAGVSKLAFISSGTTSSLAFPPVSHLPFFHSFRSMSTLELTSSRHRKNGGSLTRKNRISDPIGRCGATHRKQARIGKPSVTAPDMWRGSKSNRFCPRIGVMLWIDERAQRRIRRRVSSNGLATSLGLKTGSGKA